MKKIAMGLIILLFVIAGYFYWNKNMRKASDDQLNQLVILCNLNGFDTFENVSFSRVQSTFANATSKDVARMVQILSIVNNGKFNSSDDETEYNQLFEKTTGIKGGS